jgi:glutathione S-transferase
MQNPDPALQLYSFPLSGHAHRVRLFLSLLNLPFELVNVDLRKGEQKSEAFLALNPFGQVPVLVDGETVVADSNAILVYLAKRYGNGNWLPDDAAGAAAVQRFLSVAAGELAYGPAKARLIALFDLPLDRQPVLKDSQRLLGLLDAHLASRNFLAAEHPTIADIACYSYIAHAPEGGLELAHYPHVCNWLRKIENLPGFVAMQSAKAAA